MTEVRTAPLSIKEQAQKGIQKTFDMISLADRLPPNSGQRSVAILGAGMAVEIQSLADYFAANNLGKPKITAYELEQKYRGFAEVVAKEAGVDLDFRVTDAADPASFKGDEYDLIIVRNPNIHTAREGWRKVLENALLHLKPGGVLLATTTEVPARDFIIGELQKGGDIIHQETIPSLLRTDPYFSDIDLMMAQKKAA